MSRNWTDKDWEPYEMRFWREMSRHVGKNRAISMARLYEVVFERPLANVINGTRSLRRLIERQEWQGHIICSTTRTEGGGYYLPSTDSERMEHFRKNDRRWLRIAKKLAVQKRVGLPDYLGQKALEFQGV